MRRRRLTGIIQLHSSSKHIIPAFKMPRIVCCFIVAFVAMHIVAQIQPIQPQCPIAEQCDNGLMACQPGNFCIGAIAGQPSSGCCVPLPTTRRPVTPACQDLLNPVTGTSDCPARANLCNDATYMAVMTQQCPRTCGRCSQAGNQTTGCVDLLNPQTGTSDCPARANLCNNAVYMALMTQQCPRTCGRCNGTTTTNTGTNTGGSANLTSGCVDLSNPSTGVSECAARSNLCNNTIYFNLMTIQCPVTCNRCNVTVTGPVTSG